METSTKILLLTAMHGLPLCFAIFYRIKENFKMKRRVTEPEEFIHRGAELIIEKWSQG